MRNQKTSQDTMRFLFQDAQGAQKNHAHYFDFDNGQSNDMNAVHFADNRKLTGKTAIVSGNGKLSAAVCELFYDEGADVIEVKIAIDGQYRLRKFKPSFNQTQATKTTNVPRLSDKQEKPCGNKENAQKAAAFALNNFGSVNILVNTPLENNLNADESLEFCEYLTHNLLPYLIKGDAIVNCIAKNETAQPFDKNCAAAEDANKKEETTQNNDQLRGALAQKEIRVNTVVIDQKNSAYEQAQNMNARIGRFMPRGASYDQQIAKVILFLVSDDSACVSGQVVAVKSEQHLGDLLQ